MSARWKINGKDVSSSVRHAVIPLVSGAAVAGLEAAQAGTFDVGQIKTAAITSIIAGVIRLLQRFGTDLQGPPRVP